MAASCGMCGHVFTASDARHYPCWWGCEGELRQRRKDDDIALCLACLPDRFKTGGPGWTPVLSFDDLPKIGEALPPNTIARLR